jgi:hypothetical protein
MPFRHSTSAVGKGGGDESLRDLGEERPGEAKFNCGVAPGGAASLRPAPAGPASYEEIAVAWGQPVGTVKSLMRAALRSLHQHLADQRAARLGRVRRPAPGYFLPPTGTSRDLAPKLL